MRWQLVLWGNESLLTLSVGRILAHRVWRMPHPFHGKSCHCWMVASRNCPNLSIIIFFFSVAIFTSNNRSITILSVENCGDLPQITSNTYRAHLTIRWNPTFSGCRHVNQNIIPSRATCPPFFNKKSLKISKG